MLVVRPATSEGFVMLDHLVESHPTERRWRAVMPAAMASAISHYAILTLWLWMFSTGAALPPMAEQPAPRPQFVGIAPPMEESRPLPPDAPPPTINAGGTSIRAAPKYLPGTGSGPVVGDRPAGFQELALPTPAKGIPLLDSMAQMAVRAEDFSGRGVAGGIGRGKPPEGPAARKASEVGTASDSIGPGAGLGRGTTPGGHGEGGGGGDWYDATDLEEPPRLSNAEQLARVLPRLFPPALRDAGVGGIVVAEFIVDTEGRVETETIRVLSTPNDMLSEATRRALALARFEPGRIRYRGNSVVVKVRVNMPVEWTVDRSPGRTR